MLAATFAVVVDSCSSAITGSAWEICKRTPESVLERFFDMAKKDERENICEKDVVGALQLRKRCLGNIDSPDQMGSAQPRRQCQSDEGVQRSCQLRDW